MSQKYLSFFTSSWFISFLICMILEGSYFGTHDSRNIINSLSIVTFQQVGTWSIPVFNFGFFGGLARITTWDYSFYEGYWQVLRWFWMVVLSPGLVWGILQAFMWVYAQLISMLNILKPLLGV